MRARPTLHLELTLAGLVVVLLVLVVSAPRGESSAAAAMRLPPAAPAPAPEWLPPTFVSGPDVLALPELDRTGPHTGPTVHSRAAMVFDLDQGRVIFERRADERRPVASLTKMVTALSLMSTRPDLHGQTCIGIEQRPTRSGARSKLNTGDCASGWDYLGAALVASDNRAAYALAAVGGLSVDDMVGRMNEVSGDLDMTGSSWTDPSGLEDENLSTARDIAKATIALASVPELRLAASAPSWELLRTDAPPRRLGSTDRLLGRSDLLVEVAKTGYTDTARYCLSTLVQTPRGRRLVISLLGANGKETRWADALRIVQWADTQEDG